MRREQFVQVFLLFVGYAPQTQLPLTIKPGGKADVKVTLDTGKLEYSGEVIEVLSVITNAPSKPIMNLFITGNVL